VEPPFRRSDRDPQRASDLGDRPLVHVMQCEDRPLFGSQTIKSKKRTASFSFSSEPNAIFLCSMDGADFMPCGSPKIYDHLRRTTHTFKVEAVDLAGNIDDSPIIVTFKIKK